MMAIRPTRVIDDGGGSGEMPKKTPPQKTPTPGQQAVANAGLPMPDLSFKEGDVKASGIAGSEYVFKGGDWVLRPRGGGEFITLPSGALTPSDAVPAKVTQAKTGDTWTGKGTTSDPLTLNGSPFSGDYNGASYVNGVLKTDSTTTQSVSYKGGGVANNPLTANGVPYTGVLYGATYVNGVIQLPQAVDNTAKLLKDQRTTAQQDFKAALGELGLADLADTIDIMIRDDKPVSQIKMELPETKGYKDRFPGMEALRKAGVAINEATYISNERGFLQTLRAYGLDTSVLGSRQALGGYIENLVAPREFEERVSIAATRLDDTPEVMEEFKTIYPEVDKSAVLTYILNPKVGMDVIRKQIKTAEIGAAATKAGLKGISGMLAGTAGFAQGLVQAVGESSYAEISASFQRARQLADTQRRLAAIEGQPYQEAEAVQAVVGGDVQAGLASARRTAREAARFSERGGLTATSLRSTDLI